VDFLRFVGGGVVSIFVNISSSSVTVSSATATVCRVIRRLFLFCFCEAGGASSSRSSGAGRRDSCFMGMSTTDLTGEEAFDAGAEPLNPTKKGHVGVLLLCSFLCCQTSAFKGVQRIVFRFPAVKPDETVRTIHHILTIVRRSIIEPCLGHL